MGFPICRTPRAVWGGRRSGGGCLGVGGIWPNGYIEYDQEIYAKNRTKRAIGLRIRPYVGVGVEPAFQALCGGTDAGGDAGQPAGKGITFPQPDDRTP